MHHISEKACQLLLKVFDLHVEKKLTFEKIAKKLFSEQFKSSPTEATRNIECLFKKAECLVHGEYKNIVSIVK